MGLKITEINEEEKSWRLLLKLSPTLKKNFSTSQFTGGGKGEFRSVFYNFEILFFFGGGGFLVSLFISPDVMMTEMTVHYVDQSW